MKDTQKQRNKVDVENKTKKSLVAKLTRERKVSIEMNIDHPPLFVDMFHIVLFV